MKFDECINRRNTNSLKWNVEDDVISLGIADMDFKTAPSVTDAMQKITTLGIYGYSDIPDAFYQAYQSWWKAFHHFDIHKEWMVYSNGVVAAISSIIRRLSSPAEQIVVLSPVYNIFYHCIENNGRIAVTSDLLYEDKTYRIDFHDLEEKLSMKQTSMMLLCNPHNPCGTIWDKKTLEKIGDLCKRYGVIVISDEVHCDIMEETYHYTPFASVNETCANISITALSPSKSFNLAGLQTACLVIPNAFLRHKVYRGINNDEIGEPNIFACAATIAAFTSGETWLHDVCTYIFDNREFAQAYIEKNMPMFHVVKAHATYLLWIDCNILYDADFVNHLHHNFQVLVCDGATYGKHGRGFIRINLACPRSVLKEGLRRLKKAYLYDRKGS